MTEQPRPNAALLITFLLAYTTISGCIWHLGYWSTFKFNFLEFANIEDVFKSTIYPFFSNIWFYVVIILFSFGISYGATFQLSKKSIKIIPQAQKPIGGLLDIIIILCAGLIFIFSGLLFRGKIIWSILPFATGIFIGCILYRFDILRNRITDETLRLIILIAIALFPALNFGIAKKQSLQTQFMFRYKKVIAVSSSDTTLSKSLVNSAFLASTNNYFFFYLPDRVIIVKSDDIKSFELMDVIDDKMYLRWAKY